MTPFANTAVLRERQARARVATRDVGRVSAPLKPVSSIASTSGHCRSHHESGDESESRVASSQPRESLRGSRNGACPKTIGGGMPNSHEPNLCIGTTAKQSLSGGNVGRIEFEDARLNIDGYKLPLIA